MLKKPLSILFRCRPLNIIFLISSYLILNVFSVFSKYFLCIGYRVCTEYVQSMYRVCTEYVQSIYRPYSEMMCPSG